MTTAQLLLLVPPASSVSLLDNGQLRFRHFFSPIQAFSSSQSSFSNVKRFRIRALKEKTEEIQNPTPPSSSASASAEEITKKYGLEAGLWKIFSSKEEGKERAEKKKSKGDQAKELLAKYGGAYLATSITLSVISFSLCYVLISAGVDVQALLQKGRNLS